MNTKTVLITGANKSIGFETARQMGRAGYRIWLGSRDEVRGEKAVAELQSQGVDVRLLWIDVSDEASVQAAAARVNSEDGKLDILINNAGILGDASLSPLEQSVADIRNVYETNVFGVMRVTQAFVPLLRKAEHASIVNLSSGLGSLGWLSDPDNIYYDFNLLGYNTSKSAVNALTVAFSKALRPLVSMSTRPTRGTQRQTSMPIPDHVRFGKPLLILCGSLASQPRGRPAATSLARNRFPGDLHHDRNGIDCYPY